jgi:hypothetical protein
VGLFPPQSIPDSGAKFRLVKFKMTLQRLRLLDYKSESLTEILDLTDYGKLTNMVVTSASTQIVGNQS